MCRQCAFRFLKQEWIRRTSRGDEGNRAPAAATTVKSPWSGMGTVDALSIVAAAPGVNRVGIG